MQSKGFLQQIFYVHIRSAAEYNTTTKRVSEKVPRNRRCLVIVIVVAVVTDRERIELLKPGATTFDRRMRKIEHS